MMRFISLMPLVSCWSVPVSGSMIFRLKPTSFSEDYTIILDSFEERSRKVLFDLVLKVSRIARQEK